MSAEVPASDELITSILQRRVLRLRSELEKMRAELTTRKLSSASVSKARSVAARLGGLARSGSAVRHSDGTFMSNADIAALEAQAQEWRDSAALAEYERYAQGGRARASTARRAPDGTFI